MWLFVRESLALFFFSPGRHASDWSERTRRQTEPAGIQCDHVSLVCRSPPLPPSLPPSSIPMRTLTDCVSRGVERAGPHQKSALFSKIEKGSGRAVALGARKHPVSPRLSDAETPGEKKKQKKKKKFDQARGHRLAVNTLIPPEHLQTAQWLLLSSAVGHIKIGRAYLHADETWE